MLPLSLRYRSWRFRFWRSAPVFFLALMVAILLFLLVTGYRAQGAAVPAPHPGVFIMAPPNLRSFEGVLRPLGFTIRAESGFVLGIEADRQAGTGVAVVRAVDAQGGRRVFLVETDHGRFIKVRSFAFKADGPEL